jgi:hypothetical protein
MGRNLVAAFPALTRISIVQDEYSLNIFSRARITHIAAPFAAFSGGVFGYTTGSI